MEDNRGACENPTSSMNPGNFLRSAANGWNPDSAAGRLRNKRFLLFIELAKRFPPPVKVLDVGGQDEFWMAMDRSQLPEIDLTLLNIFPSTSRLPNSRCVTGDARWMPEIGDKEFDIVFSNSVIEHVGGLRDQRKMAGECLRTGKAHFIQTPNRYFPLEPHFLLPFFQFLPQSTRAICHAASDLGWWKKAAGYYPALEEVESIRLLTKAEMRYLFPVSTLFEEKALGLTKSFIAWGNK